MGNIECQTIACCECSVPEGHQNEDDPDDLMPINRREKVKHPFPTLPSFQIALQILCFAGYSDEVKSLLNLLCWNTRNYQKRHKDTLDSFLVAWVQPTVSKVLKFGRQTHWSESSMMYPGNEHLLRLPRYRSTRLAAIIYKQVENYGSLCAIMLVFTNGFKTPLFETLNVRNMRYEMRRINLDPKRRISKISLKVNKNAPELMLGLRLIDAHGHYILDHTWCTEEYMGNYWNT